MQIDVLKIIDELREQTLGTYQKGAKLVIIQVGNNQASNLYVKSKMKELPKWNIDVELIKLTEDVTQANVIELIERLNYEKDVNGIIVQLPLPKHINEQIVIDKIDYLKNVDGFVQFSNLHTARYDSCYIPCTPKGILHIINHEGGLKNKVVTLIGRGKTIGKPLIEILSKEPCTLICCNSNTDNQQLKKLLYMSDIVISAVGKPRLFNDADLLPNTLVIDAGISYQDGHQIGDFSHFFRSETKKELIDYTPWTKGVGKMTCAMLAVNTIKAYQMQKGKE